MAADFEERDPRDAGLRGDAERLRSLADNIPNGMLYQIVREADGTMRMLHVSAGLERLTGLTVPEVMRDAGRLYSLVSPDDLARVAEAEAEAVRSLRVLDLVVRLRRVDGALRFMRFTSRPRRLEDGRVLADGIMTDITERLRAEAEREELRERLRQTEKTELLGRLAGGVAHDFNNMLSVILNHADCSLAREGLDEASRDSFREIRDAAMRSAELARQLLAFARRQPVMPRTLEMNRAVEDSLRMLKRLIGEHIELSWSPGEALWPVRVDPAQVDQVLANLCVNARDAIVGQGRISIATANVPGAGAEPDRVELVVRDDGRGMARDVLARAFEPFFTTKELGRGTGLGLATVQGIALQNGGSVDIASRPEEGTTVRFRLPRFVAGEPSARAEEAPPPDPRRPARTRATVLVAEDETSILNLVRRLLTDMGHTVVAGATPHEALAAARRNGGEIRLVVTDVVMPGMNGRELAARVHALHPRAGVIYMSGYSGEILARHGVVGEGIRFLQKPFTRREFERAVDAALARSGEAARAAGAAE